MFGDNGHPFYLLVGMSANAVYFRFSSRTSASLAALVGCASAWPFATDFTTATASGVPMCSSNTIARTARVQYFRRFPQVPTLIRSILYSAHHEPPWRK